MDATDPPSKSTFVRNFLFILVSSCLLLILSLPILLSFDLWIFKDRGSFLNLDYLVANHYRLGVDVYYSYGLLPVLLQHLVCSVFGRSYKPMLGCTLVVMVLMALFWAGLLEHLPRQRRWLFAVVALSEVVLSVNPNWPYSLAILSILSALLLVLRDRLNVALALAAIGCFCVPSLPLVLTFLLAFCIVLNWWLSNNRLLSLLAKELAPGVLTYALLAALLGFVFGPASVAATALPFAGASYYKQAGFSGLGAFLGFVFPLGYNVKYYVAYYLGSTVTWFVLCSLFLFYLAIGALVRVARDRRLQSADTIVILVSGLLFVFIFFAYGARGQHIIYEGVLAAATLVGITTLRRERTRTIALAVYLCVGMLAETGQAYKTLSAWRTTSPAPDTLGLYANPVFAREWSDILSTSQHRKTLILAYAAATHIYYPTLDGPDAWFIQPGQLFPSQKQDILDKINRADIVVEDRTSLTTVIDYDSDIQAKLTAMRQTSSTDSFRIWQRNDAH